MKLGVIGLVTGLLLSGVSLGNGDSFLFDLGTGATDRLAGLEVDYSKLDKVFASHLHTDHIGDLAVLRKPIA